MKLLLFLFVTLTVCSHLAFSLDCANSPGISYIPCQPSARPTISGGATPGGATPGGNVIPTIPIQICTDFYYSGRTPQRYTVANQGVPEEFELVFNNLTLPAGEKLLIKSLKCNPNNECKVAMIDATATAPLSVRMNKHSFKLVSSSSSVSVGFKVNYKCIGPPFSVPSCNKNFILKHNDENTIALEDQNLLLDTLAAASKEQCAQKCCQNDRCCKAVLTQNGECLLYSYIRDSQLPVPAGATVVQEQCCYEGEQIMGEVILHFEMETENDAQKTCEAEDMTLAMPKTQCAYNILKEIAETLPPHIERIIWIGMNNPTGQIFYFNDGDTPENHGFQLPLAPAHYGREFQKEGIFWFVDGKWLIGGWRGYKRHPFFCQSKTS